jgi:hypothetical protein
VSTKDSLERALDGMRGAPFFNDFIKTLEARKADIVTRWMASTDPNQDAALKGEARAIDYIIRAGTRS